MTVQSRIGRKRALAITYLPDAEEHRLWPAILALLEPAARLGRIEPKEPEDEIFVAYDGPTIFAAFTLRLTDDALEIRLAGGTRVRDWVDGLDAVATEIAWSNKRRCVHLRGRKGWKRFGDRLGWSVVGRDPETGLLVFEKPVERPTRH